MKLVVFNPYNHEISILKNGEFQPYQPNIETVPKIDDFEKLIESTYKNLPVYTLN
jgi:hypothetical protein